MGFAHDLIYSAEKTVFLCNEIDLGLVPPTGIFESIRKKHIKNSTYREMMLFGKKFTEAELLQEKIIDGVTNSLEKVVGRAQ